jgi:hypothetical protein
MIYGYEIVGLVLEKFRGLPVKLAAMNGKSAEWYRSHGRTPKTEDPIANGNVSEVEHFMRYARKYENCARGAGQMLSHRVHAALSAEFAEDALNHVPQSEIHINALDQFQDVSKWLINFDFEHATRTQLVAFEDECNEACEEISKAKARARVHKKLLEMNGAKV